MPVPEQKVPFMITHIDRTERQGTAHRFELERPDDLAESYEVTCPSCQQGVQVGVKSNELLRRERRQLQWQAATVPVILVVAATAAQLPVWIAVVGVSVSIIAALLTITASRSNLGIAVEGSDKQHVAQKAE